MDWVRLGDAPLAGLYRAHTSLHTVADAEGLRISLSAESDVHICVESQAAHFDLRTTTQAIGAIT